jgi:hypothetical protein
MSKDPGIANSALQETAPKYWTNPEMPEASMLDDSLAMTPWERIQVNDDMMNFGEMLRTAMAKRNATSR